MTFFLFVFQFLGGPGPLGLPHGHAPAPEARECQLLVTLTLVTLCVRDLPWGRGGALVVVDGNNLSLTSEHAGVGKD